MSVLPRAARGPQTWAVDRDQLADFLRTRRESLQPEDVGMPRGPRRRTGGLRREEVATLATMSTDYYTRLEQRRGPQPSEQMVGSIARGLRLTLAERDHLFRLCGHTPPASDAVEQHVAPGLLRVLDRLQDTPAQVISPLDEILVQTPPARVLFGDASGLTGFARSTTYRWFTDPTSRSVYPEEDHELRGRVFVSGLRAFHATAGPGSRAAAMVEDLLARSPEFVQVWQAHEVALPHGPSKRLQHPEVGVMELQCELLTSRFGGQALLVFTATPGTEDAEKLALLTVLGTQLLTSD